MATIFKPGGVMPTIDELRELCGGKCPKTLHVEGCYGFNPKDVFGFDSMHKLIERETEKGNQCSLEPIIPKASKPTVSMASAPQPKPMAVSAPMPTADTQQTKGPNMNTTTCRGKTEAEWDAEISRLRSEAQSKGISLKPNPTQPTVGRPVQDRRAAATAKAKELWAHDAEVRHHNRNRGESGFVADFVEAVTCPMGDFGYRAGEALQAVMSAPASQRAAVASAEIASNRVRSTFGTADVLQAVAELRA